MYIVHDLDSITDNPCPQESDAGDGRWKEKFLQAMYFRSKEEAKAQVPVLFSPVLNTPCYIIVASLYVYSAVNQSCLIIF